MRDHGPLHLGDVDHAISKFTAEMRQHGDPWQVEGGKKGQGGSNPGYGQRSWFNIKIQKAGLEYFDP